MLNTPPTYAIYIAGLVFEWLLAQGGVAAIEQKNIAKAKLLYDYLDATRVLPKPGAHGGPLADERAVQAARRVARRGVPRRARRSAGMVQLKGHRAVGGMRASIYNAMPIEGVRALVDYMKEFERQHG